jgi:hypothetical protein
LVRVCVETQRRAASHIGAVLEINKQHHEWSSGRSRSVRPVKVSQLTA